MTLRNLGTNVAALNTAIDVRVRDRVATSYDLREWGTVTNGSDHTSLVTAAITDLDGTPDTFGDVDELVLPRLGYSINLGATTFSKGIRLTAKGHVTLSGVLTFSAGDVEVSGLRLLADASLAVGRPISVTSGCSSFKWRGGGGRLLPGLITAAGVAKVELENLDVTTQTTPDKTASAVVIDDVDDHFTARHVRITGPVVGTVPAASQSAMTLRGVYNPTLDDVDLANYYSGLVMRESPTLANVDRQCKNAAVHNVRTRGQRKNLLIDGVTYDQSQGFYIMSLQGGVFGDCRADDFEQTGFAFSYQSASVPVGWSAWAGCVDVKAHDSQAIGWASAANPSWGFLWNKTHRCGSHDNHAEGPLLFAYQMTGGDGNNHHDNSMSTSRSGAVRGLYTGENETNSTFRYFTGTVTDSSGGSGARAVQVLTGAPGTIIGPNPVKSVGTGSTDFYADTDQTTGGWTTERAPGRLVTVAANYTVARGDDIVEVSGTRTITLPNANVGQGRHIAVKNTGTGTITVTVSGGGTIDGASTHVISAQYDSRDFISDGTNWSVI